MFEELEKVIVSVDEAYEKAKKCQHPERYQSVVNSISQKFWFINPKVYLFGSRMMAVATANSDLDMYVEIGESC